MNRDTSLQSGQIAHLDKDNTNNAESNLAFLCFHHHDEYDSKSSQRKNLTIGEVKEFRAELYRTINKAFTQQVHFGEMMTPPADPYAGQYIRLGSGKDSAEISLTPLPDSIEGEKRYFISGYALWGAHREYGPNMGTLEFVGEIDSHQRMTFIRGDGDERAISTLTFHDDGTLEVDEENWIGQYGMNVSFIGMYRRAGLTN
ncbi:hypothetical protein [Sphingobium chlorophenolicum]|uniref:hypothetical protein n=1 Tax=Sphingobium chlorophenolicum TaxID=46429 RepID=UPI00056BA2A7|nr:hypothetical protein [Sphingobium chlorophenolicum]